MAKYDAYINIEIYANVKIYKYIFKYIYKGSDRTSLRIQADNNIDGRNQKQINKIEEYREV